jgi:hypothetical protein
MPVTSLSLSFKDGSSGSKKKVRVQILAGPTLSGCEALSPIWCQSGWSKPPELFRTSENLVLRLESKSGTERDPERRGKMGHEHRTAFSVPFQKLRFYQSRFMAENLHSLV